MEPQLPPVAPQITPDNHADRGVALQSETGSFERPGPPPAPERLALSPGGTPPTPPPVPPVVPQAVPVQQDQGDPATSDDNSSPTDADDIDVIEKAWVDRAKEIVHKTRADPHEQEKQVNQLQADYLKKRYGRNLGVVE